MWTVVLLFIIWIIVGIILNMNYYDNRFIDSRVYWLVYTGFLYLLGIKIIEIW